MVVIWFSIVGNAATTSANSPTHAIHDTVETVTTNDVSTARNGWSCLLVNLRWKSDLPAMSCRVGEEALSKVA